MFDVRCSRLQSMQLFDDLRSSAFICGSVFLLDFGFQRNAEFAEGAEESAEVGGEAEFRSGNHGMLGIRGRGCWRAIQGHALAS